MNTSTVKNGKRVAIMGNVIMIDGRPTYYDTPWHAQAVYRKVLKYR